MRQQVGVLEKSFSASVRVDARDLAVTGRWMREAGVGQPTRSGVLGFALRTMADSITEKEPERTVTSIQEAFQELLSMDMAPRSARDMLKLAQAMKMESMAWEGNIGDLSKSLHNYVAGSGNAGREAQQAVAEEMGVLMEDKTMSDDILALGLPKDQAGVIRDMAKKLRDQGKNKKEIKEKIDWFINMRKKVDTFEQTGKTEEQDQKIQDYKDKHASALDADSPTFERDYQERETEKLQEMKRGLAMPPQ